jgi:hypothetical protein
VCLLVLPLFLQPLPSHAQASSTAGSDEVEQLRQTVRALENRVNALEHQLGGKQSSQEAGTGPNGPDAAAALSEATRSLKTGTETQADPSIQATAAAKPPAILASLLPSGSTLNFLFDGYYEYNINAPIGRVNYLRAYDVLSNNISINQADIVFDLDPDVAAGRRYGLRLDLQFGQATDTLQGNPANEPRPEIYRNIFQAYGTYVLPIGSGLQVDVGKWSSSLGIEGNYTKDQMNYTRSLYFDFLPFYHQGLRATYKLNDKLTFNYWVVNGTQQSEATNSFKDELFGLTIQPKKSITWNVNYYLGQDHPDRMPATTCGPAPIQPDLCYVAITPAPDGKLDIFDSYVTWAANPKWTFALEGDYFIEREWANASPGRSSAPSHVDGGVAYAQYQWTPRMSFAARGEYLADPQGLFSNESQALKEGTATFKYQVADGLDAFVEYRQDWTNRNYFLTDKTGLLINHQPTATVGLVWWYGGKQGAW